ncbi:uncharacterized protein PAC_11297 [Phialocephala subalpina]|uniref:Zn(2)-C6 fungal-type domain-containing protein n=1 Tax=Phialocephala subalpina TaxID=576137 RepID=A0A1L7X8Q1_9HELO|nr:uncharacterized protein PAC_11297 [Phialocephala subalpina]
MMRTKRTRVSKPKSKGGCLTCKRRRIKCDERRPFCQRCTRFGHQCQGYDDESLTRPDPVIHKLLPKSVVRSALITFPVSGSAPTAFSLSGGVDFSDELKARYFRLFQDEISDELSAGFETTLWNRVVLQACVNDSIRQLAIATAALKKARSERSNILSSQHRKYALHQYGKALKGIRGILGSSTDSLRIALIAALLTFVFESMFGDTRSAVKNIQSALDLVNQRLLPRTHACRGPLVTRAFLPPNMVDLIDEDILKSFLRLDRPAVGLLSRSQGSRPTRDGIISSKLYLDDFQIPDKFRTTNEARVCYERIRFRVFPEHKFESKLQECTSLPEGASAPAILLMELFSETTDDANAPAIRADLCRWHRAFSPLLEFSRTKEGSSTYIPTTILHIQATSIAIPLSNLNNGVRPLPVESSDTATSDVVQLSKILVADPRFAKTFVFEMGIIPCLWIVVILHPDFRLKREALSVLRAMQPRVECVWASRIVADTGEKVVDMLEKQQHQQTRLEEFTELGSE